MPQCESLPGQGGRRPAALPSAVSRTCSNAHDHDSPQAASRARSGVAFLGGPDYAFLQGVASVRVRAVGTALAIASDGRPTA